MAKTNPALVSLNLGEISPEALARVDIDRVKGAAELMSNVVPMVEGAMMLRPGTFYVGRTRNDARARLLRFFASTSATALIELTSQNMRVLVGGLPVTRPNPGSPTWTNGTFAGSATGWTITSDPGCSTTTPSTGLYMTGTVFGRVRAEQVLTPAVADTEVALRILIARHPLWLSIETNTGSYTGLADIRSKTLLQPGVHSIAWTPAGTAAARVVFETSEPGQAVLQSVTVEAAGEMLLPTEWEEDDLKNIQYDQSADVIFVACRGHIPKRIERRDMRSWSIADYIVTDGPFTFDKEDQVTLYGSATKGYIDLVASKPIFNSLDVGQLYEIYQSGQQRTEVLAAVGHHTLPVKVTGAGIQRNLAITLAGTFPAGAKVQLARSTDPNAGFELVPPDAVSSNTQDNVTEWTTGASAVVFNDGFDNRVIYYRLQIAPSTPDPTTAIAATLYTPGGTQRCVARVAAYLAPTQVAAEILDGELVQAYIPTSDWRQGDWSTRRGWPTGVCLHDGRLCWVRGDQQFLSVSDNYTSFDVETTGDAGPISRRVGIGPVEGALWAVSLQRLLVGTSQGVFSIRSNSFDAPLTPTNYTGRYATSRGANPLLPGRVDSSAIYISRDNRKAHELVYDFDAQDYNASDLTRLASHILDQEVVDLCVTRSPQTMIWAVMADGTCRCCLHERADEVTGWCRFVTDGQVESAVVLPTAGGSEVWLSVKRTIGGVDRRFVERVAFEYESRAQAISINADAAITGTGSAANVIGNLSHLEGEQVVVWADGKVLVDQTAMLTVASGQVTLPNGYEATSWVVGLPYTGYWQSSRMVYGAQTGSATNQRRRVGIVGAMLNRTCLGGVRVGQDFTRMTKLPQVVNGAAVDMKAPISSYEADFSATPGYSTTDPRVCLELSAPYSVRVLGLTLGVEIHEK